MPLSLKDSYRFDKVFNGGFFPLPNLFKVIWAPEFTLAL